ncbi:MAG: cyclic nucleotide-binding domain-containing protein [Rhodospirillum sp.]|nr:cyclic nucleotide-binding domain-containing protein [Rhodospirillum sp.]MCF8490477.1 cyclic nucleotide-binding domain-containing protein [Rhodospirillum sp.]MCF8502958.1 cyclic nucleotide-binding domain-containing protein [Rhodospirillum sp.]
MAREQLNKHPFLRNFNTDLIDIVEEVSTLETFAAGDILIAEGRTADRFFLLTDGSVAVGAGQANGGKRVLEMLREGDVLGWSWLIEPYVWTFDGRAISPVRAIAVDATKLRPAMASNHALAHALLGRMLPVMAARLRAARMEVLAMGPEAA